MAYAISNARHRDEIDVVDMFGNFIAPRVPSVIAYATENPGMCEDVWGFEAESCKNICRISNLFLNKYLPISGDTSSHTKSVGLSGIPRGMTPVDVITDYFRHVWQAFYHHFTLMKDKGVLTNFPSYIYLTLPITWPDNSRQLLRNVISEVGFLSKPEDTVTFVREPVVFTHMALKCDMGGISSPISVCIPLSSQYLII